ncbi:hypothetical protein [Aquimarina sp. U1-2]|nr:hypothetical protein [Aquimarina sp. U1-2]
MVSISKIAFGGTKKRQGQSYQRITEAILNAELGYVKVLES